MTRIQLRRGTTAFWWAENPILYPGEAGYEKNPGSAPGKLKIGDGVTHWRELPYFEGVTPPPSGGGGTGGTGGGTSDDDIPDLVLFYNNGKV